MNIPPLQYQFSQDDILFPVYCVNCKTHIPKQVSNAGGGWCPVCIGRQHAQAVQNAQAAQAAQQAHAAALYSTVTGLGYCPQCQSTNIVQFDNVAQVKTGGLGVGLAGIVLFVVGIPFICVGGIGLIFMAAGFVMIMISLFTPSARTHAIGTSRECRYCGFRWQV